MTQPGTLLGDAELKQMMASLHRRSVVCSRR